MVAMPFHSLGTKFPARPTGHHEDILDGIRHAIEHPGEWGWVYRYPDIQAASGARRRYERSYPQLNWRSQTLGDDFPSVDGQPVGPALLVMCPPDGEPVLGQTLRLVIDNDAGWDLLDDALNHVPVAARMRDGTQVEGVVASVEASTIQITRPAAGDNPARPLALKVSEIDHLRIRPSDD